VTVLCEAHALSVTKSDSCRDKLHWLTCSVLGQSKHRNCRRRAVMYGSEGTAVGLSMKSKSQLRLQLRFVSQLFKLPPATSQRRKQDCCRNICMLNTSTWHRACLDALILLEAPNIYGPLDRLSPHKAIRMLPQIGGHCYRSTRQVSMQLIRPNLGTAHLRAHTLQHMLLVAPGAEPTGLAERTLFGRDAHPVGLR
jgi:hypothetical protein